jgi:hypothetical protein
MNRDPRTDVATRDSVLKLLSETELARVSTAESSPPLPEGEEYLDLEHVERGVRRAPETVAATALVLPRKSLPPKTWSRIVAHLVAHGGRANPAGVSPTPPRIP